MGGATPEQLVLGYRKEQAEQTIGSNSINLFVLASRFLPGVPAQTSLSGGL